MVDSFVDIFQQLKTILCLCPHCSSLLRVSQLHNLHSTAPAPRTWLDDYDDQIQKLQNKSGSVATKGINFIHKRGKCVKNLENVAEKEL